MIEKAKCNLCGEELKCNGYYAMLYLQRKHMMEIHISLIKRLWEEKKEIIDKLKSMTIKYNFFDNNLMVNDELIFL